MRRRCCEGQWRFLPHPKYIDRRPWSDVGFLRAAISTQDVELRSTFDLLGSPSQLHEVKRLHGRHRRCERQVGVAEPRESDR